MARLHYLTLAIALTACGPNAFRTPEEACLNSDALGFKDPTSLKVVANLGDRKFRNKPQPVEAFWIRYAAKNSYGAYTSANMACRKTDSGWVRDKSLEEEAIRAVYLQKLQLANQQLALRNQRLKSCNKDLACTSQVQLELPEAGNADTTFARVKQEAEDAVLISAGAIGIE